VDGGVLVSVRDSEVVVDTVVFESEKSSGVTCSKVGSNDSGTLNAASTSDESFPMRYVNFSSPNSSLPGKSKTA
jgi:hypothetical protein